jgi:PTH1 family peptidyl-tRNA hydrolase
MKLIVGLGNPGDRYAGNRHNIGFMALDAIAARHRFAPWRRRFQGEVCEGSLDRERCLLLRPHTYMNESGRAVAEAARFLKIDLSDIIVLHDELDLGPGAIKVKTGGGNAGHNGLKSITAHLGNDYQRVRLGIGHPGHKDLVSGYVLHDFAKADFEWIDPLLAAVAGAASWLAAGDAGRFQTDVAAALRPAKLPVTPAATSEKPAKSAGGAGGRHPAGERAAKRQSALADNLKRWLDRKGGSET